MGISAAAALGAAILLSGQTPDVAPKDRAKAALNRGNAAFRAGDPGTAYRHYQAAFEAFPSPKIRLNLAEAADAMGDPLRALGHIDAFLAQPPPEAAPPVIARAEALQAKLRRRVATLTVHVTPPDAELWINETARAAGRAHALRPGPFDLRVTHPGHRARTETGQLSAGEAKSLHIRLSPVAPAEIEERPLYARPWVWAAAGAILATGVTTFLLVRGGGDAPGAELGRSVYDGWTVL